MVIFQALAQCENNLTGLGLVREAVDDTAGAAKVSVELLEAVFLLSFQVFLSMNDQTCAFQWILSILIHLPMP